MHLWPNRHLGAIIPSMTIAKPKSSHILSAIQDAMRRLGTNPYQITKSSGLPLTTVQRLLSIKLNVPLRNVEMLAEALGVRFEVVADGKAKVKLAKSGVRRKSRT
jgi:hypothetical protein